jgi:hypothetical protein
MLSTKNTEKKALINDLNKNACIIIVVHIIANTYAGKKLFDQEFLYSLIFTLLGFVFYHIVFVNFIPPLK